MVNLGNLVRPCLQKHKNFKTEGKAELRVQWWGTSLARVGTGAHPQQCKTNVYLYIDWPLDCQFEALQRERSMWTHISVACEALSASITSSPKLGKV